MRHLARLLLWLVVLAFLLLWLLPATTRAVQINSRGEVAGGIAGAGVTYQGRAIASEAGGAAFLDDDHLVYQHCAGPGCWIEQFDVQTGQTSVLSERSANDVQAGGGVWASFGPYGVYVSTGYTYPEAGLGPVSPDGAVAIKTRYQSCCGWTVYEKAGGTWRLTDGDAYDIQLLGLRRALWHEAGVIHVRGVPEPQVLAGAVWWPQAGHFGDRWWLLYQTEQGGRLVLHPFEDASNGFVISPGPLTYRPKMVQLPSGWVRVAWATGEGEQPGDMQTMDLRLDGPMSALAYPAPPGVQPPGAPTSTQDVRDSRILQLEQQLEVARESLRQAEALLEQERIRFSVEKADIQRQLDALLSAPPPRCVVKRSQLMRLFGVNPPCEVVR